jgi:hypothetical protein
MNSTDQTNDDMNVDDAGPPPPRISHADVTKGTAGVSTNCFHCHQLIQPLLPATTTTTTMTASSATGETEK